MEKGNAEKPLGNVTYLRLSITDRCNLRCFYCTPAEEWVKLPAPEILRYEEMLHLARVAVAQGIRKIRVTGGEPLVRRGVVEFIRELHQVQGLEEVCLTTNGVRLQELASELYDAGLRHLNLSLDTLKRERYRELTGSDNLLEVQAGLEKAASLGFHPIKINCVVLKDLNDGELPDFVQLVRERPFQVRFIEFMPTVAKGKWSRHFLPMAEVHRRLAFLGEGEPQVRQTAAGPARIFRFPGFRGELGFISPISEHQCPGCNRLRLTAAGRLRPCLFGKYEIDVKGPLRQGADDAALGRLFREAVELKAWKPEFTDPETLLACQQMARIGG
ncbi:MAG: GTP 3',8-cyclase MoaA [Syntrophales bacterium]|nr:GTP 3',8-cyclase MoaA [Syntrophales bacterium]